MTNKMTAMVQSICSTLLLSYVGKGTSVAVTQLLAWLPTCLYRGRIGIIKMKLIAVTGAAGILLFGTLIPVYAQGDGQGNKQDEKQGQKQDQANRQQGNQNKGAAPQQKDAQQTKQQQRQESTRPQQAQQPQQQQQQL